MQFKDLLKLSVLVLIIAFFALACASSRQANDFELDVDSDEIRLALSKEVARAMIEELIGSDLECEGDVDGRFRTMLEKLDRDGPRAKAYSRDGESIVEGRRRGGTLDLRIRGAGSGSINATMPWAVAECMLGKKTTIDTTLTTSVHVRVSNPDGRNFSFRLQ
jgi:hypothetical protein